MSATVHLGAFLLLLIAAACASPEEPESSPTAAPKTEAEAEWGYTGDTGPERWGELSEAYAACADGKEQSPIDIAGAVAGEPDGAISFGYQPAAASLVNNGHSIMVSLEDGGTLQIGDVSYDVAQFHFHAPSEHTVDGTEYPLEMHVVNQTTDGHLAVVGVFIEEGEANETFESFWTDLPTEEGEESDVDGEVDASDLLPADRKAFLYDGSLTTPPCTEGVQWIVMASPIELSAEQIERFTDLYDANRRPVQPLGDREITEVDLSD